MNTFWIDLISDFNFQAHTPIFCAGVLDSLAVELKGSKDFSKLYAGIAILGYIASISEPINSKAFSHLLTFLGHRYPKVCGALKVLAFVINKSKYPAFSICFVFYGSTLLRLLLLVFFFPPLLFSLGDSIYKKKN